ncbi:MAG: c-type cytochrome biogenesis protein CcmI [Pseudomonadales bacterium]
MTFWLLALLLGLVAVAFAVVPLLWTRRRAVDDPLRDRDRMVRVLYQDRVAELEAEALAARADPETQVEVAEELGANLLSEYGSASADNHPGPGGESASARSGSASRPALAVFALALLVPLAALGIYLSVGEPAAGEVAGATAVLRLDPETQRAEIESWQQRLSRRVRSRPDDAQSQYLLGVAHLQLGAYAAAAEAFARAHAVTGDDPNIDLYWLQSRYLAGGGQLDAPTRSIAERLLAQRPNHPMVLEIYALDAYRRGDYRAAVEHINRALSNDLAVDQQMALLAGLEQARAQLGDLTPAVDVDVSAAAQVPQGATLFVIARPPGGGMPFAVIRRPAALLPLSVRLDDTTSMNPAMPLSRAPAVEVVVRISLDGTAGARPGDWEWHSDTLALADLEQPLQLTARLAPPDRPGGAPAAAPARAGGG